jgi:hypothetical protein
MYRIIYFLICSVTIISSCSRDKDADNTKQLYERLHGKYKAVSSISTEAIDVNLDGTPSTDILTEIPELAECNLEIRIVSKDNFLFMHSWPEQFVGYGPEPAGYDPSLAVNYARQGVTRTFSVDETNNRLEIHADTYQVAERFVFPSAVTMEGVDTIKVVFSKRLYTSAGWKTATITTIYKRWTMVT